METNLELIKEGAAISRASLSSVAALQLLQLFTTGVEPVKR